ncbi:hypothetical protein A6R68_05302, partial [Neotoma lepida]
TYSTPNTSILSSFLWPAFLHNFSRLRRPKYSTHQLEEQMSDEEITYTTVRFNKSSELQNRGRADETQGPREAGHRDSQQPSLVKSHCVAKAMRPCPMYCPLGKVLQILIKMTDLIQSLAAEMKTWTLVLTESLGHCHLCSVLVTIQTDC